MAKKHSPAADTNIVEEDITMEENTVTRKSLVDYILDEDYARYNELLNMAEQAKANAPKEKKPRGPLTPETKRKMAEAKLAKAQAALDALLAAEAE